ncbi:ribonuclease E activity regulator RraA [Stutzerimonas chloritidismutans]|uniref:ribonuclease E activity regulator RraA n=1 Tax=Stutzerimonas chloritidismutans TaxID=203192 RepID=UPI003F1904AE
MVVRTADICDSHETHLSEGTLRVLPGCWLSFGGPECFSGPLATLRAHGCNGEIREMLAEPGRGRVLLIDSDGHPEALLGGNLAQLAQRNGWMGVVVHGNVRDVHELGTVSIGLRAGGTWPVRSRNDRGGASNIELNINGCSAQPGEWLYADADGVLISQSELEA